MQVLNDREARSRIRKGEWVVLAAAVLWGTTGTAQAFASAGTQPAVIGAGVIPAGRAMLTITKKRKEP